MKPRYALGTAAVMVGSAVNYFGDRLLGVQIEVWTGLSYFSGLMLLDIFLVPFVSGLVVGWMFGQGGKWLCYIPPFLVRCVAYLRLALSEDGPDHGTQMNMILWGFFVILCIEAAAFGGVLGEVFIRRIYTRPESARAAERQARERRQ